MLTCIGRAACKRLVSTTFATSSRSPVVARLAANAPAPSLGIARFSFQVARHAPAGKGPQRSTTTKKTSAAATKKPTKKPAKKPIKKATKKPTTPSKPRRSLKISEKGLQIRERRELKKTALFTEPKLAAERPWLLFISEHVTKNTTSSDLRSGMAALAQAYKSLSVSEKQRLEAIAVQNKIANAAIYTAWVESHTPDQIAGAMNARRKLKTKYNFPKGQVKSIKDDRLPKRAVTAFGLFTKARWGSGDYANHSVIEASKSISKEWKSLPEAQRETYQDLANSEQERYRKEVKEVFDRKPAAPQARLKE